MPSSSNKNIGKHDYFLPQTKKSAKSQSRDDDFLCVIDEGQAVAKEPSSGLYSKQEKIEDKAAEKADNTLQTNVPSAEQPRERFLRLGPDKVTNVELIAIMLRTGTTEKNVLDLARYIYNLYGCSLLRMGQATVEDLMRVKGLGEAKSIAFVAALELGRRRAIAELDGTKIKSSEDCFNYFKPRLAHLSWEELHAVAVDGHGGVIGERLIAKGGLNGTMVDLRILMGEVVRMGCQGFMVAHNHPSGSVEPSRQDRELTERIVRAARTLDIRFLDHVIVPCGSADDSYFSFADQGLL